MQKSQEDNSLSGLNQAPLIQQDMTPDQAAAALAFATNLSEQFIPKEQQSDPADPETQEPMETMPQENEEPMEKIQDEDMEDEEGKEEPKDMESEMNEVMAEHLKELESKLDKKLEEFKSDILEVLKSK